MLRFSATEEDDDLVEEHVTKVCERDISYCNSKEMCNMLP